VQCVIAHGPNSSASLKLLARKALTDDGALEELKNYLLQSDPVFDAMLRTTQAVDIIYGGEFFYIVARIIQPAILRRGQGQCFAGSGNGRSQSSHCGTLVSLLLCSLSMGSLI
jgi:hypothetical protein